MLSFVIPLSVAMGLLGYGLAAAWYVVPGLDRLPRRTALTVLILPHVFRYVGLVFIVPGVVSPDLSPAFAVPSAYGDLATSLLALLAVFALRFGSPYALAAVWVFNVVGTLDLLVALFQGAFDIPNPGQFGGAYLIPTLVVPALLVLHVLIFRLLLWPQRGGSRG